jgi:Ion channel
VYDPYSDASNPMWCVILGMTTVGFGDIIPNTNIGRLFVIVACFAGSFIITLITVTISTRINHD